MKNILLKSSIIILLFSTAGIALSSSSVVNINNSPEPMAVTQYQCRKSNVDCVVDKIKYIRTGAIYYDAECNASDINKSDYEADVINDVQSSYFHYCSKTSRTLKSGTTLPY